MKKISWIILIGFGFTACNQTITSVENPTEMQPDSVETVDEIEKFDDEFLNAEKYRFEYQNEKNEPIQMNSLSINYFEKNKFRFRLETATKQGCIGQIIGFATITDGFAKYTDEECQSLLFQFSKSKITVEETDCGWEGNYHGAGCSFDGEYTKYPS